MITGVIGKLGGCKSLSCVSHALECIRRGVIVITNIDLKSDAMALKVGYDVGLVESLIVRIDCDSDPWSWPRGDDRGTGPRRVCVIIDEAGEWFSFDGKKDKAWRSWLRQSDKRGQDVFLIVQDMSILAKQGRVLVHVWHEVTNMGAWRMPLLGWHLPPPWRNQYRVERFTGDGKTQLGKEWRYRDPALYSMYTTAAMFGESAIAGTTRNAYDGVDICEYYERLDGPLVGYFVASAPSWLWVLWPTVPRWCMLAAPVVVAVPLLLWRRRRLVSSDKPYNLPWFLTSRQVSRGR